MMIRVDFYKDWCPRYWYLLPTILLGKSYEGFTVKFMFTGLYLEWWFSRKEQT